MARTIQTNKEGKPVARSVRKTSLPVKDAGISKKRSAPRFKQSTIAKREIKYYQSQGGMIIPRAAFSKLVRSMVQEAKGFTSEFKGSVRFQRAALDALQEGAEDYLVETLSNANDMSETFKRKTLQPEAMRIVDSLTKDVANRIINSTTTTSVTYGTDSFQYEKAKIKPKSKKRSDDGEPEEEAKGEEEEEDSDYMPAVDDDDEDDMVVEEESEPKAASSKK